MNLYHKRRLSPSRKKLYGADDDDEGCQTGVDRTRSRKGARAGLKHGLGRGRVGARAKVGVGKMGG